VSQHAARDPDGTAFVAVGVLLPDGIAVHVAYLAAQKAGVVVVCIGPRAGRQELRHLLTVSGATALISGEVHRDAPVSELVDGLPLRMRLVLPVSLADLPEGPSDALVGAPSGALVGAPSGALVGAPSGVLAGRALGLGEITCSTARRAPRACRNAWYTTRIVGCTTTSWPSRRVS
jgi:acyl-CoA synthetase (AMP-forming)/AMP-acid ligase II